jgi:uncharacterized phage protein (TIGR02220 family)
MGLVSLIASNNYIVVNKQLARAFGLEEAVLLGELASEMEYWQQRGELKDGYFYSTIDNVKDSTTLSDKRQRSALTALKDAGIVDVKLAGLPAKRYVRINENQLAQILLNNDCKNGATSFAETAEQETPKQQANNNKENSNKKNNNKDIYISVIDYLNSKAGTHYRASSKATQQHINARLAEGYTVEDFQRVVDNMCICWLQSEWEQYLRPSTLFGSKFENYLNRKPQGKRVEKKPKWMQPSMDYADDHAQAIQKLLGEDSPKTDFASEAEAFQKRLAEVRQMECK